MEIINLEGRQAALEEMVGLITGFIQKHHTLLNVGDMVSILLSVTLGILVDSGLTLAQAEAAINGLMNFPDTTPQS